MKAYLQEDVVELAAELGRVLARIEALERKLDALGSLVRAVEASALNGVPPESDAPAFALIIGPRETP